MIFSTDVREDIAKWARDNNVDPNSIVAFETSNPPPRAKPGTIYKPISVPVDVPGMKLYQKITAAPTPTSVPNFSKLDPAPPEPKLTGRTGTAGGEKSRKSSATQPSVGPKGPSPKPVTTKHRPVDRPQAKPQPKSIFPRKGGKK